MGFTSTYSCDGLADKIKLLLTAAGARQDSKICRPVPCAKRFGRPDKFARADLTFYTLAPSGTDTPPGTKPVDAVWRPVSIAVARRETSARVTVNSWSSFATMCCRCSPRATSTITPRAFRIRIRDRSLLCDSNHSPRPRARRRLSRDLVLPPRLLCRALSAPSFSDEPLARDLDCRVFARRADILAWF